MLPARSPACSRSRRERPPIGRFVSNVESMSGRAAGRLSNLRNLPRGGGRDYSGGSGLGAMAGAASLTQGHRGQPPSPQCGRERDKSTRRMSRSAPRSLCPRRKDAPVVGTRHAVLSSRDAMSTMVLSWTDWRRVIAVLRENDLPYMVHHATLIEALLEAHSPGEELVALPRTDDVSLRSDHWSRLWRGSPRHRRRPVGSERSDAGQVAQASTVWSW